MKVMCRVLGVSASGYFRWQRTHKVPSHHGPGARLSDAALLVHIRAIHVQLKGEYGWPRMHKELRARGIQVGKERVRRLMQEHGIRARTKRKFVVTTDSKHHLPIAPDLVQRRFTPQAPHQLWSGDITYIATDEGWLYLAVVLDLHSRQVVGWSLQPHMQKSLVRTPCSWPAGGETQAKERSFTATVAASIAAMISRPRSRPGAFDHP